MITLNRVQRARARAVAVAAAVLVATPLLTAATPAPATAAPPAVTAPPPAAPKPAQRAAPVITRDFPDPSVLAVGGTYWAYSTASGYGRGVRHVPVARSGSMTGPWTDGGDAMPTLPPWMDAAKGGSIWAPDVSARSDGSYLLYFTGRSKTANVQCIGAALARSPKGPFTSTANPLVCRPEDIDSIDPKAFSDGGKQYLLYTSGRGNATIWAQPMSRDGLTASGERRALLVADRPEENKIIEAPSLVRKGGKYVLFYSGNAYNSGAYFTNYATANSLAGPFVKAPGQWLNKGSLGGGFTNPGGQDVVPGKGGRDYLVFHGYARPGQRSMYVAGLRWSGAKPTLRLEPGQSDDTRAFTSREQLPGGDPVPVERRSSERG
jgi:beta-xylosidase